MFHASIYFLILSLYESLQKYLACASYCSKQAEMALVMSREASLLVLMSMASTRQVVMSMKSKNAAILVLRKGILGKTCLYFMILYTSFYVMYRKGSFVGVRHPSN